MTTPGLKFTEMQEHAIETTARAASVLSILGCLFIVITFATQKTFRKPVNRLIFYASWGNLLMNIGTLMSLDGIRAGKNSASCQIQAFLIQMFLPADALWNLSMAFNVWYTVFKNENNAQLKRRDKYYHFFNYGCTFAVAFIYCFVSTPVKGKMYGPAVLWCWVSSEWDAFRVILCYGPAWLAIFLSFVIYSLAGKEIFRKRRMLREFRDNPETSKLAVIENPFTAVKTIEIDVTSELAESHVPETGSQIPIELDTQATDVPASGYQQYTVAVESGVTLVNPLTAGDESTRTRYEKKANNAALEANAAALGYTKCATLFFMSLLITWVPSSCFRVWNLIRPGESSFPLAYAASLVLPLMGFWNAVIYITVSRFAIRDLFQQVVAACLRRKYTRRGESRHSWNGVRAQQLSKGRNIERKASISDSIMGLNDSTKGLAI